MSSVNDVFAIARQWIGVAGRAPGGVEELTSLAACGLKYERPGWRKQPGLSSSSRQPFSHVGRDQENASRSEDSFHERHPPIKPGKDARQNNEPDPEIREESILTPSLNHVEDDTSHRVRNQDFPNFTFHESPRVVLKTTLFGVVDATNASVREQGDDIGKKSAVLPFIAARAYNRFVATRTPRKPRGKDGRASAAHAFF